MVLQDRDVYKRQIEYFITLCELPLPQLKDFDHARFDALRAIYKNFSEADAQRIKAVSYTHLG